jgi:tetratricopeptide (TPR) repeat protein
VAPGQPDLYQLQAIICAQLGDIEAALDACQLALRVDAWLVQVWLELARLEERRENWTAASAAYGRALDLLPTFVAAALGRADLVRRTESPRAAIVLLVDLLSADPYEFDAQLLLGRALLDDGRARQALEAFDRILRFVPQHPEAHFYRGVALARERQFTQAVTAWDQVVQLAPGAELATAARSRARSARDLQHILAAEAR